MDTLGCVRRVADAALASLTSVFATIALCLLGTGQAFAIPSPELVVGSFVSISQLLALASAVLGGGAAFATMRARRRRGSAEMSRGLIYTALGLFAAMTVSIGGNIWQYVTDSNARQERLEATLTRPMPKSGGAALDPTLKEVSYAEQLRSPRGISTEEMEKLLEARSRGERQDTILLDIRETAETKWAPCPAPGRSVFRMSNRQASTSPARSQSPIATMATAATRPVRASRPWVSIAAFSSAGLRSGSSRSGR